ncbi:hypothetical protein FH972_020940 [Carpinus fangiana]|uniref:Uncharacterized protein n=1 Tax=Carpinus fangiana TaxID=176857 RepID=A0A5N6RX47_9ROSI|nr:hypothetical protein FH972_020940 [Carpinus fangiana]
MRPSAMLRSLSFRPIPARLLASPAVTPLPIRTSFDRQLSAELNTLYTASAGAATDESSLLLTLEASISTQKIALHSLSNLTYNRDDHSDHKAIDEYLDLDSIQMLDACNHFSEKIEIIRKYVESLRVNVVSHLLDGQIDQPSAIVLARANNALQSCEKAMERSRRTRKLLSQRLPPPAPTTSVSELDEIISGSKAVALMACRFLGHALSFKSKRCCSWPRLTQKKVKVESEKHKRSSSSMTLTELRVTARELRDHLKSGNHHKLGVAVEKLRRSCGELEERIDALEERVKVLYKHLIDVRMALLGILSQA